jgi:competence protein ComFC
LRCVSRFGGLALLLIKDTLDALASIFFPAPCWICDEPLTSASLIPICDLCIAEMRRMDSLQCEGCGRPFASPVVAEAIQKLCYVCRRGAYHFEQARSYGLYNDALSGAILLLKYESLKRLGAWFADRLVPIVRDEFRGVEFDAIVPVPLHPSRQLERGYNQAELIARPLAKRLGIKMATYLLVRTRPRPAKSVLTLKERWESVRGAYETRTGAKVDKLRILLVDDVFTTGATLDACSRALRDAGAASVHGVTVARVVPELTPPRVTRVFRASNMVPERPKATAQAQ